MHRVQTPPLPSQYGRDRARVPPCTRTHGCTGLSATGSSGDRCPIAWPPTPDCESLALPISTEVLTADSDVYHRGRCRVDDERVLDFRAAWDGGSCLEQIHRD